MSATPSVHGETPLVNGLATQVSQLVGVPCHIDRGDPILVDLQCRGLQGVLFFDRDETRQAVDEGVAHEPRSLRGEQTRQRGS
jgi:hypothetical protein